MQKQRLTDLIEEIQEETLETDQYLIVNMEFSSRAEFEFNFPFFNEVFETLIHWGADPTRNYLYTGPKQLCETDLGSFFGFLVLIGI